MKSITLITIGAALFLTAACERVTEESIQDNALVYSLNLSHDEMNIWETLTPSQRDRAAMFIRNGGTLIASLGDK
ncbi:hypothetical protein A9Q96_11375 [Rhodobacterales bacterium 52_120_T64]|mgnify:CR=1 FL=1|nr:hypothetical protein A9Q96_11375 [Rhodobacterales bacterium 52_120_T64]